MSEDWLFNYCEKKNVLDVIAPRLLLGKKFVNLLGSAAITNIWAIIVNPLKFVDRLEGSDTHSPPLFILELGSREQPSIIGLLPTTQETASAPKILKSAATAADVVTIDNIAGMTSSAAVILVL